MHLLHFILFLVILGTLTSDSCDSGNSLKCEFVKFSKSNYPPHSQAWNKTFGLLAHARQSTAYLVSSMAIYEGVLKRVARMLNRLDIKTEIMSYFTDAFYATYRPGYDVVFEVSYLVATGSTLGINNTLYMTPGSSDIHKRVILQSEQLNAKFAKRVFRPLKNCHFSPTCVVWEYSDFNYHLAKVHEPDLTPSFALVPTMIQPMHSPLATSPFLGKRGLHVAGFFHGAAFAVSDKWVKRRALFRDKILETARNQSWNVELQQTNHKPLLQAAYSNASTCPTVHASMASSAGEYHRLSEIIHYGCVPIFETFADTVGIELLRTCAKVYFATYDDMIPTISSILSDIKKDGEGVWKERMKAMLWWQRQDVELDDLLVDIFGPLL
jgi:hypothetical protein